MASRKPQQNRGHQTRQAVLDGAGRAFDRFGFGQASLSDIVRESGVTAGSLYFFFPSKQDIALAVIAEQNLRTGATLEAAGGASSPLRGLIDASRAIGDQLLTDPLVRAGIRLSLEEGTLSVPTSGYYQDWIGGVAEQFRRAQEAGEVSTRFSPEELGRTLVPYFTGVHLVSSVLTDRADLYEVLSTMWRVFVAGVASADAASELDEHVRSAFSKRQPALVRDEPK
ncbi:ScbR family autoregulator-binding transcription factor [Agromyces sp. NPDC058104]|uniref:ScbR family autoregulator-binding transcription factor n=1 Tax=Agromyces sp. NPDC058104 TaxID=3346342 RepID=UPI0036D92B58